MKPCKKVALLHDLCGVGKAALTNMIPILSVMGVEACPIPTMLLSTHTGGFGKPALNKIPASYICECADHYKSNGVVFDVIFVGYLGDSSMIDAICYFIETFPGTPVILDPIMGDHGRYYSNFNDAYGKAMKRLLPFADIILPNLTECCMLLGKPWLEKFSDAELLDMCRELSTGGEKTVIITSIAVGERKKGIAVYAGGDFQVMDNSYIPSEYHGTGDAFDGVFVGEYAEGMSLLECIRKAHDFVYECIRESNKYDYDEREGLLIEKNLHMIV